MSHCRRWSIRRLVAAATIVLLFGPDGWAGPFEITRKSIHTYETADPRIDGYLRAFEENSEHAESLATPFVFDEKAHRLAADPTTIEFLKNNGFGGTSKSLLAPIGSDFALPDRKKKQTSVTRGTPVVPATIDVPTNTDRKELIRMLSESFSQVGAPPAGDIHLFFGPLKPSLSGDELGKRPAPFAFNALETDGLSRSKFVVADNLADFDRKWADRDRDSSVVLLRTTRNPLRGILELNTTAKRVAIIDNIASDPASYKVLYGTDPEDVDFKQMKKERKKVVADIESAGGNVRIADGKYSGAKRQSAADAIRDELRQPPDGTLHVMLTHTPDPVQGGPDLGFFVLRDKSVMMLGDFRDRSDWIVLSCNTGRCALSEATSLRLFTRAEHSPREVWAVARTIAQKVKKTHNATVGDVFSAVQTEWPTDKLCAVPTCELWAPGSVFAD